MKQTKAFTSLDIMAAIALPVLSAMLVIAVIAPRPGPNRQAQNANTSPIPETRPSQVAAQAASATMPNPPPPDTVRAEQKPSASPTYVRNGVTVVTPPLSVPYVDLGSDHPADQQTAQSSQPTNLKPNGQGTTQYVRRPVRRSRMISRNGPPNLPAPIRRFFSSILP